MSAYFPCGKNSPHTPGVGFNYLLRPKQNLQLPLCAPQLALPFGI
ncbi:hypothetical protein [Tenacibaculum finnmarkense]|nr:hypothetical protein [Tenacibaculum finnmarkense]